MSQIKIIVEFIVLDIFITYGLLLGWPWFHLIRGVTSTLHQKIKFLYSWRDENKDGCFVVYSNIGPPGF